jgi:hypothetical protein
MKKKAILILFLLSFAAPSLAATIGGPEITIPEESLYLKKQEAVNKTLDRLGEYNMDIKGVVELDFIAKRKLATSFESTALELKGQSYMLKFSNNFYNVFEPYIKIGTSDFEVEWKQNALGINVETKPGFVWAMGAKLKLCEFKDSGVKLTLDGQYRDIDLDIDIINQNPATSEVFQIKELQMALLASKKFVLPLGMRDYYIVPYTGLTFSWLDVDVSFWGPSNAFYSTYKATDENNVGLVFGCDVMPSLLSWYLMNFEIRLLNETAFSFGGTVKF